MSLFIVCELGRKEQDLNGDFTVNDYLFEAVKLGKNADPDKFSYSGYGIGFDSRPFIYCRILFRAKMLLNRQQFISAYWYINKDISILGKGLTQGLDDTRQQQKLNILFVLQDQK